MKAHYIETWGVKLGYAIPVMGAWLVKPSNSIRTGKHSPFFLDSTLTFTEFYGWKHLSLREWMEFWWDRYNRGEEAEGEIA